MTDSIKEQSLSGLKWNTVAQFAPYVIRLVTGLIIARLLEPDDYGVVGMLAIFMAISQSFVDCGFGNALGRGNRGQAPVPVLKISKLRKIT